MATRSRPFQSRKSSKRLGGLLWWLPVLLVRPGIAVEPPLGQPLANRTQAEQTVVEAEALARREDAESLRQAIRKLQAGVAYFRAAGDARREAGALLDLGEIYEVTGDRAAAMASDGRARDLWQELGDSQGEAKALTQLGLVACESDEHEKASAAIQDALRLFRSQHDARGEGAALDVLGQAQERAGQREESARTYERALAVARNAGDRREEAFILNNSGMLFLRTGGGEKALTRFREALPLAEAEGARRAQAVILNNLGLAQETLGDELGAEGSYESLLPVARSLGDPALEGAVETNLGGIFYDLGEAEQALAHHERALAIWRGAQETTYIAVALNNIGAVYDSLGEYDPALDHFEQSLALRRAAKDSRGEATVLSNIGETYSKRGDFRKALEDEQRALSVLREAGDREQEAGILNNLGKIYSALGDETRSLELHLQALPIRREIGDLRGLSITLQNIGTVYRDLGEMDRAKESYAESLSLARQIGDHRGEGAVHLEMSRLLQASGDLEGALAEIQQAVEILERQRDLTNRGNLRSALFVRLRAYYEQYLDVLFDLRRTGRPGMEIRSLEISERARSRSLLDTLLEARVEIRKGVAPELLAAERQLQARINRRESERRDLLKGKAAAEQAEGAKRAVDELLRQLDRVRSEIRKGSPEYPDLTQPEPLHAQEIQDLLDPNTLFLSYFLGERRSFVWVVTRSSIELSALPPRSAIEAAAKELHSLLSRGDRRLAREPADRAALRLAGTLLGPVERWTAKTRLAIVADGALHYVPFAVLPVPGRGGAPLAAEHEIVNLPSASVLAVLRRMAARRATGPRQVAILADPVFRADDPRVRGRTGGAPVAPPTGAPPIRRASKDLGLDGFPRLRHTREEAEWIASLLAPGEAFQALDFDASKEVATGGRLAGFRILHFATHGLLDTRRPELSGLVLSLVDREGRPRDGFLRLHEIYNLELPSDLVVLSGCETALGKEVRGEGLMAMTRGFMYAGAAAVVASLWQVDDRSTAELMRRFYHALFQGRLSPSAALRAAQVSLRGERRTAAPYFWAGFVFEGDWRADAVPARGTRSSY